MLFRLTAASFDDRDPENVVWWNIAGCDDLRDYHDADGLSRDDGSGR